MNQAITPQKLVLIVAVLEVSAPVLAALYYTFPPLGEQRSDRDNLMPIFYDLHCWFAELGFERVPMYFVEHNAQERLKTQQTWDGHWRICGSDCNVALYTDLNIVYTPLTQYHPSSLMIYRSIGVCGSLYTDYNSADFEWQTRDGEPVISLISSNWPKEEQRWVCPKEFSHYLKKWMAEKIESLIGSGLQSTKPIGISTKQRDSANHM